jgi:hypothetical protein
VAMGIIKNREKSKMEKKICNVLNLKDVKVKDQFGIVPDKHPMWGG